MIKRVRSLFNRKVRPRKKRSTIEIHPTLCRLENRLMLSVSWINPNSGDWDTPSNWSTGALPGLTDDVTINQTGITVTHSVHTTDTVKSLTSRANVTLSGGTLALTGDVQVTGTFNLAGGTLAGASVDTGTTLNVTNAGGTLSGVTLGGTLNLSSTSPTVNVTGGLTLSGGGIVFGASNFGVVRFSDAAASLSGTGLVDFNNASSSSVANTLAENVAGGTLTIGPHITITGGSGGIGYNSHVGGPSNVSVINQGTINANTAGTITIDGTGWSNTGTVEASGGGNLSLFGTGWTNSGTVTASGGTLNLGNNSWSNTGTVTATNTTTNLGGTFTLAKLGSFTRTGGAVNLTGTLNNTGGTLALNAATGSWNLAGGTIDGGTVTATAGAFLEATNTGGTLKDGVTLSGDPSLTNPIVLDLATSAPRSHDQRWCPDPDQHHGPVRSHKLRSALVQRRGRIALGNRPRHVQ